MKRALTIIVAGMFLAAGTVMAFAGERAPQKVFDLTNTKLTQLGADPLIVKAVKAENAKGKTLEQIREIDRKWKAQAGIADYMQVLMNSECGRHLRNVQRSAPYYGEIFVMDNQGAIVAMTDKTSDYWQGDEDKFRKSYGTGAIFVDEIKFDDSTQAYLVQVSVPVKDGERVIGAITIGIDAAKIK